MVQYHPLRELSEKITKEVSSSMYANNFFSETCTPLKYYTTTIYILIYSKHSMKENIIMLLVLVLKLIQVGLECCTIK